MLGTIQNSTHPVITIRPITIAITIYTGIVITVSTGIAIAIALSVIFTTKYYKILQNTSLSILRITDRRTDGPTDGRKDPLIEMRGRI